MSIEFTFLHTADLHLGASPDRGYPWSGDRARELWDMLRRIILAARQERAAFLFIAGDLFHHPPTMDELHQVNALFAGIPDTQVVLMAGNHDFLSPGCPYLTFPWSQNVTGLFADRPQMLHFPQWNTRVYGLSYFRQEVSHSLYDGITPARDGCTQILLAHGGDAKHSPMDVLDLVNRGFDYVALGHIHRPTCYGERAWQSGAPCPIDSGDPGEHGYVLGRVKGHFVSTRFVPLPGTQYRSVSLPCREEDTTYTLLERLQSGIRKEGGSFVYRVQLTGEHRSGSRYDGEVLMRAGRVLEVADATHPAIHIGEILRDDPQGIAARFIRSFEGHEQSALEQKAMRYGLEALLAQK